MTVRPATRRLFALAPATLLVVLAACENRVTQAPSGPLPPEAPAASGALECRVTVREGALRCGASGGPSFSRAPGGAPLGLIVGGQGTNVQLTSANARHDAGAGLFHADVSVQNLMPEALGTAGWFSVSGVRVFVHSGPTTTDGSGAVEVANADGERLFTGTDQPYFEYADVLLPNAVSAPRTWTFRVDPGVVSFAFTLYVEADREDQDPGMGKWRSVSAGTSHTCALRPGGEGFCWGGNGYGQVGAGDHEWRYTPTAVSGDRRWRSVSAGLWGTCAAEQGAGAGFCWGYATAGETTQGVQGCPWSTPCVPAALNGDPAFRVVSTGNHHSCGLSADGEAFCWGLDVSGQLGSSADADSCQLSYPMPCSLTPVPVDGSLRFNDIVAGSDHTCALARGGEAFCWGYGSGGRRGDGTSAKAEAPVAVSGGLRFSMLDTFEGHTCGLTADGEAWCWGANDRGEVGVDALDTYLVPVAVQGGLRFRKIAVGFDHTCALEPGGEAWCWGGNFFGQLGDGAGGGFTYSTRPVAVAGGLKFRDLDTGHQFTCGVTLDGDAYCWGVNVAGQLGVGSYDGAPSRCHYEPCALAPVAVKDPE